MDVKDLDPTLSRSNTESLTVKHCAIATNSDPVFVRTCWQVKSNERNTFLFYFLALKLRGRRGVLYRENPDWFAKSLHPVHASGIAQINVNTL